MSSRAEVVTFIRSLRRRDFLVSALTGATVGLCAGTALAMLFGIFFGTDGLQQRLIIGGAAGLFGGAIGGVIIASMKDTVADVERRIPALKNLLLTSSELIAKPKTSEVNELVFTHTADAVRPLAPSAIFPAKAPALALLISIATWASAMTFTASSDPNAPITLGQSAPANAVGTVDVTITPPSYTKRETYRMTNPTRIEALAGSRIALRIRGRDLHVETLDGALTPVVAVGQSGSRAVDSLFAFEARADGFVAIRAGTSERRIIGLTVTPDQAPRVRVAAPGKDMMLSDAKRSIPVEITAQDDIALTSLKLRYTKISGSGERFTFVEGEVPVTLERPTDLDWRAKGTLDLSALKLEPGDMVVYRGAARDGRPGLGLTESDAFIVEITSPGSVAAEGFAMDDQQDKYALSQQMVILKTERLLARAATMSPESLTYNSLMLAAEQRSVRAEFVFMMGGEVGEDVIAAADAADIDETHEAENEGEILAGRLVNRGRRALVDAIRQMSRASTALNEGNPRAALPMEKAALVSLQEAFSRTRYLLRALTLRERLDMSRRLTGVLALASSDARGQPAAGLDSSVASLRRSLQEISLIASGRRVPSAAGVVAQQVLSVDPSDSTLQRVASHLSESRFQEAALDLAAALRARLPRESADTESPELRQLRGALNDVLRGRTQR
jgi:hypothetical protein